MSGVENATIGTCSIEPTFPPHTEFYTTPDRSELIVYTLYEYASFSNDKVKNNEMAYYRIGARELYEPLDGTLYAIPIRNRQNSSAAAAAADSATNADNYNGRTPIVRISKEEFITLYKSKYLHTSSSTLSSLLKKEQTDRVIDPEENPLDILHSGYTTDSLIDALANILPIHYVFDGISEENRPDIMYTYNPDQKPTSLEKFLIDHPTNYEFQAIYGITEFLRSYIDIYHDFLHYGRDIINTLKKTFEDRVLNQRYLSTIQDPLKSKLHRFYIKWIQKIDSTIFTSGGRVIQPACHQLIEEVADEYIKLLSDTGIKWMPNSKTNAFIGTYSLNNDCDVTNLVRQLHDDGVDEFYVESANSHIGKALQSKKMRVAAMDIGEWDAGSGYGSFKQGKVNTVIGTRSIIVKASNTVKTSNKVQKKSYNLPSAPTVNLFGFVNVGVENDYKTIVIKNMIDDSTVRINGEKDGYTQLSLNRVATTIGLPAIRGEGEAKKLNTTPSVLTPLQEQSVATLKTWTDYIQIKTFSFLKSIPSVPKIGMVINDKCCETSARMNGLGCVLKNEGSNVTYYSYDIDSRIMSKELLDQKRHTLLQVLGHIDALEKYVGKWFDIRISMLEQIKSLTPDPILYFSSLLFSGVYASQKEKALKEIAQLKNKKTNSSKTEELKAMIKGFPLSVSEWLQSITNSEGIYSDFISEIERLRAIVQKVGDAGSRDLTELRTYSEELKQIIVNSLGKLMKNDQQLSILVSTTLAFILFKKPKSDKYITSFKSIFDNKQLLATMTNEHQIILQNSSTILQELLEIEHINKIWRIQDGDFKRSSSLQGSQESQLSQGSQDSQGSFSIPITSFKNVYLTRQKTRTQLTYLSDYQTYFKNNSDTVAEYLNYGFEGIYNRAMCMLLDTSYLPSQLASSPLCISAGPTFKKRGISNSNLSSNLSSYSNSNTSFMSASNLNTSFNSTSNKNGNTSFSSSLSDANSNTKQSAKRSSKRSTKKSLKRSSKKSLTKKSSKRSLKRPKSSKQSVKHSKLPASASSSKKGGSRRLNTRKRSKYNK